MLGFGGKKVKTKNGKTITLLNPAQKARKFADELSTNMHFTNDGEYKPDKNGEIGLTDNQRAYRSGYLDSRKDCAKAHKYNEKKGKLSKSKKGAKRTKKK